MRTHELSVAEEVDPLGVDGLAVLGPGEGRHRVALHRRRDPQLLTLVHRHVAQGTAEEVTQPCSKYFGQQNQAIYLKEGADFSTPSLSLVLMATLALERAWPSSLRATAV